MFTSVKRKLKKRKSPIRSRRRRSYLAVKNKEGGNVTRWVWVGIGVVLVVYILLYVLSFANSTAAFGSPRALQGGVYDPGPNPVAIPFAYPVHNNNENGTPVVAGVIIFCFVIIGVVIIRLAITTRPNSW